MAHGGARAGAGRKPGVPNKATACIRDAAREYTNQALSVLVEVMTKGDSAAARVAAANSVLDRAYGKPSQALEVDANLRADVVTRIELVAPGA